MSVKKEFKAYYTAGVGQGISVSGQTVSGIITRIYATERSWFDVLHKE